MGCRRRVALPPLSPGKETQKNDVTTTKSITPNPTGAQADRYRREVGAFVEALEAGRLDEGLVGEIEEAFAHLGRVVGLDFKAVRREAMGMEPPSPKSRSARLAALPDVFTWKDVAEVWGRTKPARSRELKT